MLGTFDPTVLSNDAYVIRLVAKDLSGFKVARAVVVGVSGNAKLGQFAVSFTDLSIPLAGIPIQVTRRYNSFEADGLKEAALMEAYLDWRVPDWRNKAEEASDRGQAGGFGKGRMSVEEARAVLEVAPDASKEDIRQAHRRLMMKLHPDQGGSNYLAARINEAKDVLLGG